MNTYLGLFRKAYIKQPWLKVIESIFFSVATTSVFFWSPWFANDCIDMTKPGYEVSKENADLVVNYDCPENHYSPLATLFFNTEGAAIRSIISRFEAPGGILVSW